jgi:hypothetical protein
MLTDAQTLQNCCALHAGAVAVAAVVAAARNGALYTGSYG